MNFQVFLAKILDIANFPENKKQKFLEIFYQYYFVRLTDAVGGIDPAFAQRLASAIDAIETNPEAFGQIWREMMGHEDLKKVIEDVTDEVVGYLVDDVMKNSSDEQKAEIQRLASS